MAVATRPAPIASNWAESGDKTEPSDSFKASGWPLSQVPPTRQKLNWILGWLTQGVRNLLAWGIPEWNASETYPPGAHCSYAGTVYQQVHSANTTNVTPGTDAAKWLRWGHTDGDVNGLIAAACHLDDVSSAVSLSGAGDATVSAQMYTSPGIKRVFVSVASRASTNGAFDVILSGSARLASAFHMTGNYVSSVSGDMPGAVSVAQTASSETTRTIHVVSPGGTAGSMASVMLEIVGT
jgi:hypothetical protein